MVRGSLVSFLLRNSPSLLTSALPGHHWSGSIAAEFSMRCILITSNFACLQCCSTWEFHLLLAQGKVPLLSD